MAARLVRRTRRGAILLVLALVLLVLLGVAALAVDLGQSRLAQAQLQVAADAGALAGANMLDETTDGLEAAHDMALAMASTNKATGVEVVIAPNPANLADGDVVLGTWDADTSTFVPSYDPAAVDAVLVRTHADGLVPLLSRAAFARDTLGASAGSIAIRGLEVGAGEVPWYLPFGLPSCLFETYTGDEIHDMVFVLNPAGADNVGWASVDGHPSASWIIDQLMRSMSCMHAWMDSGTVDEVCAEAEVGDDLGLSNGEATSALKALAGFIESDGVPWKEEVWGELPPQNEGSAIDPAYYGQNLVGPVPIFASDSVYCDPGGGNWVGTESLAGFAWLTVFDVRWQGAAEEKNVWVKIDIEHSYPVGSWFGGDDYGITATGPARVVK